MLCYIVALHAILCHVVYPGMMYYVMPCYIVLYDVMFCVLYMSMKTIP